MVETLIGWMKKAILPADDALRAAGMGQFCHSDKSLHGILRYTSRNHIRRFP
jgi:hypothetical protein